MRTPFRFSFFALLSLLAVDAGLMSAQALMTGAGPGGAVNIFNTDLAVLESGDVRNDLPCTVTPQKPILGFDLRFHAGYEVSIPIKEFAGSDNMLTTVFRVINEKQPGHPVYFSQRMKVPVIQEEVVRGDATLGGAFDVGEGSYHVDWLMRDRSERVCSFYWDAEAALVPKDRGIALDIGAGEIRHADMEQFKEEPPVSRNPSGEPLNVKVLVNFAPQNSLSPALQPIDTSALASILRTISRDPQIGKFSVTAFNMQQQRVLYRQVRTDRIDFPALGQALDTLKLGTVSATLLGQKHGETDFLADLIKNEIGDQTHPDAVIFAGPKALLDQSVPQETLKEVGELECPVFYMNYNLNPQAVPWKDAISRTVKFFRGYEYTISRPRDLWFAVSEMVGRIVKSRNGKHYAAVSTH